MARLYANENFPLPVVIELRRLGHDVLTTQEAGKADPAISDEDVLAFACADARAVLTLNRKHFLRLHHTQPEHQGIMVCTYNPEFLDQAARIDAAIQEQPLLVGQLLRVNRPQERQA